MIMRGIRKWLSCLLLVAALNGAIATPSAQACPMCKAANETQEHLPRAYQFSILFMLAMPAMLFSGIGFSLYRISKHETQLANQLQNDGEAIEE